MLKEICEAVRIPVVAIGGIGEENMEELADSGIAGIAVISAIMSAKSPQEVASRLKEKVFQKTSKNLKKVLSSTSEFVSNNKN